MQKIDFYTIEIANNVKSNVHKSLKKTKETIKIDSSKSIKTVE